MAKMTPAEDAKKDKAAGIKPGSKKDNALDRKRGLPPMNFGAKKGAKKSG